MELKEEFIELRQKYADIQVYRGCTDGSEELAYYVYKSALESFKKKIESKKWKLTLNDSIVEGTGMNDVLEKEIMYLDVNEVVSFEVE